jgi:hypothetical protein
MSVRVGHPASTPDMPDIVRVMVAGFGQQEAPAIRMTRYLRRKRSWGYPFVKGGILQSYWQVPARSANKRQFG